MQQGNLDGFFGLDGLGNYNPLAGQYAGVDTPLNLSGRDITTLDGPSEQQQIGSLDGSASIGQVFAVELTAGVTYSFAERPTATGGIEDAFLRLYSSSGSLITYDDDGGAGRSSLLSFTPTTSGTYYLAAGSWVNEFSTGGDVGNFTLDQWSSNGADAPSTMAGAVHIGVGTTFGQLSSGTDVDMYQIDLTHGQFYTFGYSGGYDGAGETGNIARIQLLDSAGNVITSGLNTESGMSYLAQNDGTYYVRVTPYTALGTAHGGYTLDVSQVDPATQDPLDAIRWQSANNIPAVDTDGDGVGDTAYVYFAPASDGGFGEVENTDDYPPGTPITTYGWEQYQIDGVMSALQNAYTPITGIHYVQTTDLSQATFRLVTTINDDYGARFYPQDPSSGSLQGLGIFNLASGGFGNHPESLDPGGFSYAVVLHEFGHAHGLAHPHDHGGGSDIMLGVTASQGSYGIYNLNQGVYTVMSYNDGWPLDPDGHRTFSASTLGSGWSQTLSPFDIAALQERYGVHANNTGDNVYTIADNQADASYQAIWDTGGNDTIAYTGTRDAQIDLLAATLDYSPTGGGVVSFAHGVFGGYTIAHNVVIENATGGSGNDVLLGNSAANVLTGNDGNDSLIGREGNDLLVGGAGNDSLTGSDGVDTATFAGSAAGVTVNLATGTASGEGSDTLNTVENVIGSAFQDRIIGDAGVNTVKGGNGIDVITLGGGNDVFVAEQGTKAATKTGSWSWDVITDFDAAGDDAIDLSGLGSFHWIGTNANKAAGDLSFKVYDSIAGAEHALGIDIDGQPGAGVAGPVTIVYGNTDGGSADFAIVLLNTSGVDANDFIFSHPTATASLAGLATSAHQADYFLA
jgi:Ca2+-binding RTX toxin-like protein